MSRIFSGGSRGLGRLNSAIRTRLHNLITNGHAVLVGDANGVDKAIQSFFAEQGYRNVIVYCMGGGCRNNIGDWPVEVIDSVRRKKDFSYFAKKDEKMSMDADYGFMIWDGESKGTLNNALNLILQGKAVLIYRSPSREFIQVRSIGELEPILSKCSPEVVEYLNKRIKLDERLGAANQIALGI